jgi:hypothetical protein
MKGKFNTNRDFGVEIEFLRKTSVSQEKIAEALRDAGITCFVEGYNHETRNYWKIVGDSSVYNTLRGYEGHNEIVSPRLNGRGGLVELEEVLKVLNNLDCKVNFNCGIHVHHDVTEKMREGSKQAKKFLFNLIKWVGKFEHCIYKLVAPSRLDNRRFSVPVRQTFEGFNTYTTFENNSKKLDKVLKRDVNRKYGRDNNTTICNQETYPTLQQYRSCGLNLRNVWTRGSIEFRYHNGILNFEKISNWIVTTQAMVNVVENKGYVCLKHVEKGKVGFNKFLVALGFTATGRDNLVEKAKKYNRIRFRELSQRELEYQNHNDYSYVADGLRTIGSVQ